MSAERPAASDPKKQEVINAYIKVGEAYQAPEEQRLDFGMFVTETVSPYVDALMALHGIAEGSKDRARSLAEVAKMKKAYEAPPEERLDFAMFTTEVMSPYLDAILGLDKTNPEGPEH